MRCTAVQAATTHEIGHLLGLGHPDSPDGEELATGFAIAGNNSYNALLLDGGHMNASSCLFPWEQVTPGLPPRPSSLATTLCTHPCRSPWAHR